MRHLSILTALLLAFACDPSTVDVDSGSSIDSGTNADSGGASDSAVGADTGTTPVDTGSPGGPPPGADTAMPFPVDRGDEPGTPGLYRGLALRLVDNGEPTITPVDGVIGVVCIGMSNATQECSHYISQLSGSLSGEVSSQVVVVDCAVGGNAIERWNDSSRDAMLWDDCVNRKIPAAGIRVDQVRVIYHKAANQFGNSPPFYPDPTSDYFSFFDNLGAFATRLPAFFPTVQAVYTTSRSFGGFTTNPGRGEPRSYEEGHALNAWLADNADIGGVWYGWGPYIWAPDCTSGETNGSDVCYDRDDFQADGVHPNTGARDKIAQMIHDRLSEHAWYRP